MTLGEFKAEAQKLCQQQGQAYLTDASPLNKLANEVLREYSRRTNSFFSDRIPFTPVIGQAVYRFDSPSATFDSKALVSITNVFIRTSGNLQPVRDLQNYPGPVPMSTLQQYYPDYLSEPNGQVKHYSFILPHSLVLWPAPSVVTGTHFVSAFYYHPVLAADGDLLVVPAEDERSLSQFFAYLLLLPNASGESETRASNYLQMARADWDKRGEDSRTMMQPSAVRMSNYPTEFSMTDTW